MLETSKIAMQRGEEINVGATEAEIKFNPQNKRM